MSIEMLEAILRIRTNLHFGEKCCRDFEVTEKMVSLFKSDIMYSTIKEYEGDYITILDNF